MEAMASMKKWQLVCIMETLVIMIVDQEHLLQLNQRVDHQVLIQLKKMTRYLPKLVQEPQVVWIIWLNCHKLLKILFQNLRVTM